MPFPAFDPAEVAQTLRETEQRYRAVFERAPAPMFVVDGDTLDIIGVNDAAVSRYGYSRDEFLSRSLRDLWPPYERGTLFRVQGSLKAGHEVRGVFRHWTRSEEPFDVELLTRTLPLGDARLRVVLAFDASEHTRSADVSSYLDRASGLFAATLDFRAICRNLAAVAIARLGDWCAVHRVRSEGTLELAGFSHANPLDELVVGSTVRARNPLAADHPARTVRESGRSLVLAPGDHTGTVMRAPRDGDLVATGDVDRRLAVHAAMYLPISARGRVLAVLECVAATDDQAHAANNLALGEELASRAGLALDGALMYEEARSRPAAQGVDPAALLGAGNAELILEQITDGFIALDTDWRVTFANRMAERILNRPTEEMIGQSFWEAFPDVAGTEFDREYRRAATLQEPAEFEAYYVNTDAWYSVRVHPSRLGLAIFFRDTTEAHRAEEDRRDSNRILYDYADQSSDLIHLVAPDGRIVYANPAWRRTLGYEEGDTPPANLRDIVAPEFRHIAAESLARRLKGDSSHVSEVDVLTKDGRRVRVQGRGTTRFAQGRPIAILGIFRDVTAQRESAAALEAARMATLIANRTKTEFLDRMNHELRTPLTGIIGFARLLERNRSGGLSAVEKDFAARIARLGGELLGVIEDVLAYAEIEGRRLELKMSPVALDRVVAGVVEEFGARAQQTQVSIVTEIPSGLKPIATDEIRIRQILRHLVDNAIKFSDGDTVTVSVVADEVTGTPHRLEVTDRGIGIPEGQVSAMLEPFEQAAQHSARKFGGVGLGLTIARSLARLMGFELVLRSRAGEGTRAVLILDRPDATEDPVRQGRTSGEHESPERESVELATLLHAIVHASPLAVIVYDTAHVVRLWNDAAVRIFGWSAEETIGQRTPSVPDVELPRYRELFRRALETGGVTDVPMRRVRKDGSVLDARTSVAPLRDAEGGLLGFVTLVADVTDQVRRDAQLRQAQKMEVVGQLAGGIAHDFNNLLTVIGASASFLLEGLDRADPRRRDVEEIQRAGTRAAGLTRQLLTYARKQLPELRVVDMRGVVDEARGMLKRLIGSNVEMAVLRAPIACQVLADPAQLEQIVMNLVLNARDAMPRGGALVVETTRTTIPASPSASAPRDVRGNFIAAGDYVTLIVSDTGQGMERTTLQHIFEPFYTTKAPGTGTGLGLATVDTIVSDAGGFIEVETTPGAGTIFRVHLPVVAAHDETAVAPSPTRTMGGHEVVLLVEDEEVVRSVATRILRSHGYSVLTARHGKDAMDLAARHDGPIDLLLTDVVMPEVDGYLLAARLRAQRPAMRVLFMTGYSEPLPGASPSVRDEGGAVVQKPFTADDLAAAVRNALDTAPRAARSP